MNDRPLRLVIAGGGTGGHVLPAIAVVEELRHRGALGETLWIGSTGGVEGDAAARADIPFRSIRTGKLRRYLSARTAADAARIPVGVVQSWRLLRAFRPSVVFSSGGFVSVPTVVAATRLAPILTHEQTAIVGLANHVNARFADVFAVSWDETRTSATALHRRVVVTGNPVRRSLTEGDAARGFARLGFDPALPLLYVTGGVRGASPVNKRIGALLPELLTSCQVLHQAGPADANDDAADMTRRQAAWPESLRRRYRVVEFVRDELPDVLAAASLVLGRAGAGTVAELAVLAKPAVLIPLPGAGGDEQTRNGRLLADAGGAILLPEREASPARLGHELRSLLADPDRLRSMGDAARTLGRPDAAVRLVDELIDLARGTSSGSAPSP
jgi:UDP-N-acetylglucosamine--N-acetylmuramyl-(pentapeptide) pyrophosphoryl-undecaprenol N-acetylglucosamine transferase